MHANGATASGAGPSYLFISQNLKASLATLAKNATVLKHQIHEFLCGLSVSARKYSFFLEGRAGFDLAPGAGDGFMNIGCPAARTLPALPSIWSTGSSHAPA